jgi:hypothetical protein
MKHDSSRLVNETEFDMLNSFVYYNAPDISTVYTNGSTPHVTSLHWFLLIGLGCWMSKMK